MSAPSKRLTNEQVTAIAVVVAQKAGYRLDDYKPPTIGFDANAMRWSIFFDHKAPGFPGGYISIWVDDRTGAGTLLPSD
jgi:hypothetical protein